MIYKPMLAATVKDIEALKFPLLATPKLDGIRCVIKDEIPVSRTLKQIPNKYVSKIMQGLPNGLDGELMIEGADFNTIQSKIMSEDGEPNFQYHVFDYCKDEFAPYIKRTQQLDAIKLPDFCRKLFPQAIKSVDDLNSYEAICIDAGFEGVMLRTPDSPYKYGRSTVKEQYLMKLKRFDDSEARIIGFEELMHNDNTAEKDLLGHTKRASNKANLRPAGTLGTLIVEDIHNNITFGIGTGFTVEMRRNIWSNQPKYIGKIVNYKYQGIVDKPRFPSFRGFRSADDL